MCSSTYSSARSGRRTRGRDRRSYGSSRQMCSADAPHRSPQPSARSRSHRSDDTKAASHRSPGAIKLWWLFRSTYVVLLLPALLAVRRVSELVARTRFEFPAARNRSRIGTLVVDVCVHLVAPKSSFFNRRIFIIFD